MPVRIHEALPFRSFLLLIKRTFPVCFIRKSLPRNVMPVFSRLMACFKAVTGTSRKRPASRWRCLNESHGHILIFLYYLPTSYEPGFRSFSRINSNFFDTSLLARKNRNDAVRVVIKTDCNMLRRLSCIVFHEAPFRGLPHTTGYAGGC